MSRKNEKNKENCVRACVCDFFFVPLQPIWVLRGYGLWVTGYGLQVTGYGLWVRIKN